MQEVLGVGVSLWGDFAIIGAQDRKAACPVYAASVAGTETVVKKFQADMVSAFQEDHYIWDGREIGGGLLGHRMMLSKRPDGSTHGLLMARVFFPEEEDRQRDGLLSLDGDLRTPLTRWFRRYTPLPYLPEWADALLEAGEQANLIVPLETLGRASARAAMAVRDIKAWSNLLSQLVVDGKITIPDQGGENGTLLDTLDLDGYLTSWGPALAARAQKTHTPLWDPTSGEERGAAIKSLLKPLFEPQADVAEGLGRAARYRNGVILCGAMGTGKTRMGGSTVHRMLSHKGGYRVLVQCPKHLLHKWVREIQTIIPGAKAQIVERGTDMLALCHTLRGTAAVQPEFYVFGRDQAKLSWTYSPAAIWDRRRKIAFTNDKGERVVVPQSVWRCPTCFEILKDKDDRPVPFESFRNRRGDNARCPHCNDVLWQAENGQERFRPGRLPGSVAGERAADPERQVNKRNSVRRCSIAWAVKRKGKGLFDAFVADECHELKGGDSAQGVALGTIASAVDKVALLTGTLFGGLALDVFYLLWRIQPQQMLADGQDYRNPSRWVNMYGRIEVELDSEGDDRRNSSSRSGVKQQPRMRPGISPVLYGRHLLDSTAFIDLEDVAPWLPAYTEIPDPIDLGDDLAVGYRHLRTILEAEAKSAARRGDLSVFAKWIQTGLGWPDKAMDWPAVCDKRGALLCTPQVVMPGSDGLYPKERRLLEIIERERSRGRKCAIYQTFTGTHDMLPRLAEITRARGFHPMVLRSNEVKPEDREEWIAQKLKAGGDLLICHPKVVETGLDLYAFPTILWLQTGTSLFPVRQASRRSYRIGQTEDVEVRFLAYSDTLQTALLQLMAQKMKAAAAAEGSVTAEGLRVLAGDDDGTLALAQALMRGMDGLQTAEDMWRKAAALAPAAAAAPAEAPKVRTLFDAMPVVAVRPKVRRGAKAGSAMELAIDFSAMESA